MAAVIEKEKTYRPTTGEEAIDLILNEFHKQLVNSGIFPLHRVWHEFEIQGGVRVKGWRTKTEEVKFEVSMPSMDGKGIIASDAMEHVEERVDARIVPQPPDILRESLPDFPCPNCGRIFHSKPSMTSHWKIWCKAEVPAPTFAETSAAFREHSEGSLEGTANEPNSSLDPAA